MREQKIVNSLRLHKPVQHVLCFCVPDPNCLTVHYAPAVRRDSRSSSELEGHAELLMSCLVQNLELLHLSPTSQSARRHGPIRTPSHCPESETKTSNIVGFQKKQKNSAPLTFRWQWLCRAAPKYSVNHNYILYTR